MRNYILAFLLLPLTWTTNAQVKWETGVFAGGAGYMGDLSPGRFPLTKEIQPAAGGFVRYHLNSTWSVRSLAWYGQLKGSDANFPVQNPDHARNYSFQTSFSEVDVNLEWDPFGKTRYPESKFRYRPRITPYFLMGIGMSHFSSKTSYNVRIDENANPKILQDVDNAKPAWLPVIPFGAGLKIDLGKTSTLAFETLFRYTRSDNIDGVSQTGNPKVNDYYSTIGVHYSFRIVARDSDGDGIIDKMDRCKLLAGVVTAKGCPDKDGDGIEDAEDICMDIPGLPEFSGCPDTDCDGIMDSEDNCPFDFGFEDTGGCPDGDNDCVPDSSDVCPTEAGLAQFLGCPDSDGDNYPDKDDPCPFDQGMPEYGPCPPPDTDCDGLIDRYDRCPEIADTTTTCGCPDTDKDGIIDLDDRCPKEAGVAAKGGCPEVKKEDLMILIRAQKEVRFKTSSAVLLPSSKKILDLIAEMMTRYPFYQMTIVGHTDSQGKDASNLILSKKRAQACQDYLKVKKILVERMKYDGKGETQPIADNKTVQGRVLNRRVTFDLVLLEVVPQK
jgi:outer membrane protein OmpA-like peptidoglycan-associated protein